MSALINTMKNKANKLSSTRSTRKLNQELSTFINVLNHIQNTNVQNSNTNEKVSVSIGKQEHKHFICYMRTSFSNLYVHVKKNRDNDTVVIMRDINEDIRQSTNSSCCFFNLSMVTEMTIKQKEMFYGTDYLIKFSYMGNDYEIEFKEVLEREGWKID